MNLRRSAIYARVSTDGKNREEANPPFTAITQRRYGRTISN